MNTHFPTESTMPYPPFVLDPVVLHHAMYGQSRSWCRPIYLVRHRESKYVTLFPKLREDPVKFQNYTRMSLDSFQLLHSLIEDTIRPGETNYRRSIFMEERL
jgi:hypothetical protein